jgi:hypothetical protein
MLSRDIARFQIGATGRALGRTMLARDAAMKDTGFWGTLALVLAPFSMTLSLLFILASAFFARMAVREQRRFDSILTRSLAAALAEGDADLAEAA